MKLRVAAAVLCLVALAPTGQERVSAYKALDTGEGVHEYMTRAATWLGDFPEVSQYLPIIEAGATHEDVFDHVYHRTGACVTITHFWDPDIGTDSKVSKMWTVSCEEWSAWVKVRQLWGMALGEYYAQDYVQAYEYLGHVAHLLEDMTVPAHVHMDSHVYPDEYDDNYMSIAVAQLNQSEIDFLKSLGPVQIPEGVPELYWLFYTTAQVGDFYASDDDPGDMIDFEQWMDFSWLDPDHCIEAGSPEDGDCDMTVIRSHSYFHGIRAVAGLYKLFQETVKDRSELTVSIQQVTQLQGHDENDPDYFVNVRIGDVWFTNEGSQITVDPDHQYEPIYPGWAFARNVGFTGTVPVWIELWDDDDGGAIDPDDQSDIFSESDPDAEERSVWLNVDLATGAISGDLTGTCGVQMCSAGDDTDRSEICFTILLPNQPPVANAGSDQVVHEADAVTLNGSFTDPNAQDTHTVRWHMVSSSNGQFVEDVATDALSFTPADDGVYVFQFTVTDNLGAQGSDIVAVTSVNVPPVAHIGEVTDETGARIGIDVPVALAGLTVGLAGTFNDVGMTDSHVATIDWGDGSSDAHAAFDVFSDCFGLSTGAVAARHVYAAPGVFTITLRVTDNSAGVGTATFQVEVVDASGAIAGVIESLAPLAGDPNVQAAIDKLQGGRGSDANNGTLDKLEQGNLNAALEKIVQALQYLEAFGPHPDLTHQMSLLTLAAKSVTVGAIARAEAAATGPDALMKVALARTLVQQGDPLLAGHSYSAAAGTYQVAARQVQGIR